MAQIPHHDIGDVWVPQATFTVGGTPTDPTTLTVRIKKPDGTLVAPIVENTPATPTLPIVRVSAGVFKHAGIALDSAGYWFVRFEGTGAAAATEEHQIIVDPSEFTANGGVSARALVGLAETKDWLQQQNINTAGDLELVRVINDISDRIHQESEREFKPIVPNPATRTFAIEPRARDIRYVDGDFMGYRGTRSRFLDVGDLTSFTAVQILDADWTTVLESVNLADITSYPLTRHAWEPIRRLEFQTDVTALGDGMRVTVAGNWGFPAVPGNIRQATLDGIAMVMDRDVEHYSSDLGAQAQEGQVLVMVGAGRQRLLSLPPSALAACWLYRFPSLR